MKAEDILNREEFERYKEEWVNFRGRYKPNKEYNVHSGLVVISEIYQFEQKPIFRAHVFNNWLKKFDPYFIAEKYLMPFWHITHYNIVLEQVYHAASTLIRDRNRLHVKDVPLEFRLKEPVFWRDNVSVELIIEEKRKTKEYLIEDLHFTIYDDKKDKEKSRISVRTFVEPRAFIKELKRLKSGENEALKKLIKKIERQEINLKRLKRPRKNLRATKEELVEALKNGYIPEEDLYDFFSLWDKEPEPNKFNLCE